MKKLLCSLLLISTLSSCGYYSNIPAQYHIVQSSDYPLTAEVAYTTDSSGKVSYIIKNPKLMLEGEPGSIGVTFDKITIKYLPESLAQQLPPVTIATTFRIGSSHFRDSSGALIKGFGVCELPIINTKVAAIGTPPSGISTQISAQVELEGFDDAGFPAYFSLGIPINFTYGSSK